MQLKSRTPGARPRWWLVLALLASMALNIALLGGLYLSFGKLQMARVFPLGIPLTPPPDPAAAALPKLVMIGDSRALMWRTGEFAACLDVSRIATGGHASTQVRLALAERLPPRGAVALVQFGINDLHPLRAFPQYGDLVFATLLDNLDRVTQTLLDNGNPVVLSTLFPPGPVPLWRRPFWDPRTPGYIEQANAHIRALAQKPGVSLLDAHAVLTRQDGWIQESYADADFFLHVNAAGYAALNRTLAPLLAGLYGADAVAACQAGTRAAR